MHCYSTPCSLLSSNSSADRWQLVRVTVDQHYSFVIWAPFFTQVKASIRLPYVSLEFGPRRLKVLRIQFKSEVRFTMSDESSTKETSADEVLSADGKSDFDLDKQIHKCIVARFLTPVKHPASLESTKHKETVTEEETVIESQTANPVFKNYFIKLDQDSALRIFAKEILYERSFSEAPSPDYNWTKRVFFESHTNRPVLVKTFGLCFSKISIKLLAESVYVLVKREAQVLSA